MYLTPKKSVATLRTVNADSKPTATPSGSVADNGERSLGAPRSCTCVDSPAPLMINFATPEDAIKAQQLFESFEARLAKVEAEQKRFTDALLGAGKMMFENPQFKMITMAFPKDVKQKLQEFFCNTVTPKNT